MEDGFEVFSPEETAALFGVPKPPKPDAHARIDRQNTWLAALDRRLKALEDRVNALETHA